MEGRREGSASHGVAIDGHLLTVPLSTPCPLYPIAVASGPKLLFLLHTCRDYRVATGLQLSPGGREAAQEPRWIERRLDEQPARTVILRDHQQAL